MTIDINFKLIRRDFSLDVSLSLPCEGITVLFGRSGAGKSTLLRCIAGLESDVKGKLLIQREVWQDTNVFVPAHQRSIGFVFQQTSLFSHLTIFKNLQYALRRNPKRTTIDVDEYIQRFDLEHLLERKPNALSVGEQQRVALARALMLKPRLLLLDEPLTSLDVFHKQEILPYLLSMQHFAKLPMIYVSHDIDEALLLANYFVVLNSGSVLFDGITEEVLSQINTSSEKFPGLGDAVCSLIEARVIDIEHQQKVAMLAFSGGVFTWPINNEQRLSLSQVVRLRILANDVIVSVAQPILSNIQYVFRGQIVDIVDDTDQSVMLLIRLGDETLYARMSKKILIALSLTISMMIWVQIHRVILLC